SLLAQNRPPRMQDPPRAAFVSDVDLFSNEFAARPSAASNRPAPAARRRAIEALGERDRSNPPSALPELPDLLQRPRARPSRLLPTHVRADGVLGWLDLDESLEHKAVREKEAHPLAVGQIELDHPVRPLAAVEAEVLAPKRRAEDIVVASAHER